MAQKMTGALVFDERTDRYDIRFDLNSYYDHIIRDQLDYDTIWQYIDENPAKWPHDQFYTSDGEEHP